MKASKIICFLLKKNFINQLKKIPNKEKNYNIQIDYNIDEKQK